MASATVTTSMHPHRASFSGAGSLPSSQLQAQSQSQAQLSGKPLSAAPHLSNGVSYEHSNGSFSGVAQMPSASQQSQSSQQSYAMNPHPSQQGGSLSASGYRPFADSSQPKMEEEDPMKIYSVWLRPSSILYPLFCSRANLSYRPSTQTPMYTKWTSMA